MARPKDQTVENERRVRIRAVADDDRSGRFIVGDVFEMPLAKALLQMELGKVEPVIEIRDRHVPIPEDGCSLYEAYRSHMCSYPEIAEVIDNKARTIGGLKFGLRFGRQSPKWPGIKPAKPKRPSDWDWREAARRGDPYPRTGHRSRHPITSSELQFETGMHAYRLQHARSRFFELLSKGQLRATGIPEDRRFEATMIAIPAEWWSWDIGIRIDKGEIYEISSDGKSSTRAWRGVRILPPIKRKLVGRKQGGRPSSRSLIIGEFERRKTAGDVLLTLSKEAALLEDWLANQYPDQPPATAKTIQGQIREDFNAYWAEKSNT